MMPWMGQCRMAHDRASIKEKAAILEAEDRKRRFQVLTAAVLPNCLSSSSPVTSLKPSLFRIIASILAMMHGKSVGRRS